MKQNEKLLQTLQMENKVNNFENIRVTESLSSDIELEKNIRLILQSNHPKQNEFQIN